MFGFLKDKLKQAVSSFSKKAEEELDEEPKSKKSKDAKDEKKTKSQKQDNKNTKKESKKESSKEDKKKSEKKDTKQDAKIDSKKHEAKVEKKHEEKKEKKENKKEEKELKREEKSKKNKAKKEKADINEQDKAQEDEETSSETSSEKKSFFGAIKGFFGKSQEESDETKEKIKGDLEDESESEESDESNEAFEEEKNQKRSEKKSLEKFEEETERKDDDSEEAEEEKQEKKGFFSKITDVVTKKTISQEKFEELFWDFEIGLLESNVALEVIEKIKQDMQEKLVNSRVSRFEIEHAVLDSLKKSIDDILTFEKLSITKLIKEKKDKPYVVVFVGVNGSGKTTNLAKIAHYLKEKGFSVVLAAGDTFRAAAIHQLEIHAEKIGVKIIKQDYGSDSAAVAFDAIAHAKANKKDVVLVDTAGRSHANSNLMDELKKVIRVSKPDLTLFVGDSITGNDMVEQAREFNSAVNVDGLILSKADVDEKGGATISAAYVTKKPIVFIGTGQEYDDIEEFDKAKVMKNLEI